MNQSLKAIPFLIYLALTRSSTERRHREDFLLRTLSTLLSPNNSEQVENLSHAYSIIDSRISSLEGVIREAVGELPPTRQEAPDVQQYEDNISSRNDDLDGSDSYDEALSFGGSVGSI